MVQTDHHRKFMRAISVDHMPWADHEVGGQAFRTPPPPPEKSQKYRVFLQYWSGSPENHKATKPAFNVGPSSARQRNAIYRLWPANSCIWILPPLKNAVKVGPPLTKLSGSAHAYAVQNKLTITDQITVPLTTESAFMYPTVMTYLFDRIRVTNRTYSS